MDSDIKILVVKYITGQASEKEADWLKAWMKESPENEAYFAELYETWHNTLITGHQINTDKAYTEFLSRTGQAAGPAGRAAAGITQLWRRIAAAAAIVLCLSAGFYYFTRPPGNESELTVVNVTKGSRKKLVLPDGSKVWINAGSTLKYEKDFGETSRTVYLNGEAYFDIAPGHKKIPFLVKTRDFVIRDIGTIFNIKAYSGMPVFEATVLEGEVSVEGKFNQKAKSAKVFLKRRQVLKIDIGQQSGNVAATAQSKLIEADVPVRIQQLNPEAEDQYIGWKDGLLAFHESTFEQIAQDIERRYNVRIIFENKDLKDFKYSGSFRSVNDVTTVLEIIKKTTPINYSIIGDKIIIKGNN